jgi:hypothetical protein
MTDIILDIDGELTPAQARAKAAASCPFCGGPVGFYRAQGHAWNPPDWRGTCFDGACAGYVTEPEGQWHTQADAVAGWAKRAPAAMPAKGCVIAIVDYQAGVDQWLVHMAADGKLTRLDLAGVPWREAGAYGAEAVAVMAKWLSGDKGHELKWLGDGEAVYNQFKARVAND